MPPASRRQFLASAAVAGLAPALPAAPASQTYSLAMISGSVEYKSDESLERFQAAAEATLPVRGVRMFRRSDADIAGLERLAECDAALFFTRRLTPPPEQLKRIRDFLASGKPVLGVRTASHGFQNYLAMDAEVFGGSYKNHTKHGVSARIEREAGAEKHPILDGVSPFSTAGGLYINETLSDSCVRLLRGDNGKVQYPVAWARERPAGGAAQRIFYTSLGTPEDFGHPAFQRLLLNAVRWGLRLPA